MELRKEFLEFIRDRSALKTTTVTISIPTLVSLLSTIAGRLDVLGIGLYIIIISFITSNSIYILFAQKEVPAITVHNEDETKKSVVRYQRLRPFALCGVALSILLIPFFGFVSPFNQPVQYFIYGKSTPIPIQPPTTAPPPPQYSFLYYMIVLDASERMKETFEDKSKWEAALESLEILLKRFNPDAHYSLVTVGGRIGDSDADPCEEPSKLTMPFDTKINLQNQISQLGPIGEGSIFNAYNVANIKLEELPIDAIRTLIFITGSSDGCDPSEEWAEIKKVMSVPGTIEPYSEIIILDETGFSTTTLEELNNLSENINVQAPKDNAQLEQSFNNVAVNVEYYCPFAEKYLKS